MIDNITIDDAYLMLRDDLEHTKLPNGMAIFHCNYLETQYIYQEVFEEKLYAQGGIVLKDGDCVFDLGANIGLFTLFIHHNYPKAHIYAFEPMPPIFDVLSSNVDLHDMNATLFQCAVSSEPGTASFTYYPNWTGHSGRYGDPEEHALQYKLMVNKFMAESGTNLGPEQVEAMVADYLKGETFECELRTLSDIIAEQNVECIDLLKIDVEGSEVDVIKGIKDEDWSKIRQLVIEVHSKELGDQLLGLLTPRGYQCAMSAHDNDLILYALRRGG